MHTLDDIARTLQGYDPQALRMADTTTFIDRLVAPVQGTEVLPLRQCLGRVLAEDLISGMAVPAHDNSAMDGYALRGSDLSPSAPTCLAVLPGTSLAGQPFAGAAVLPGQCVRITTGAVMPAGLDTEIGRAHV